MKAIKSSIATLSFLASAGSVLAAPQTGTGDTLGNPTGVTTLADLFTLIFNLLIGIVGGLAIIFLIIGGIRYILASGDEKATKAAKEQITAALIGLVVAVLAVILVLIIGNIFGVKTLNVITVPSK